VKICEPFAIMVLVAWIFWNKMVMSRAYSIFSSPANFLSGMLCIFSLLVS
jgi:hypothetical protein